MKKALKQKNSKKPLNLLHISLWRTTSCVKDRIKDGNLLKENGDKTTYTNLLNECPESFLSGASLEGTFESSICFYKLNEDQCLRSENRIWKNGECLDASGRARSLVIKIDPVPFDKPQLWEFRLTNENLDKYRPEQCAAEVTNEETGLFQDDKNALWHVIPGGIIKTEGRLCSGLLTICGSGQDYVECDAESCNDKASPDPNDNEEAVGGVPYVDNGDDGECNDEECELLAKQNGNYIWRPKYEILCETGGYWNVCNDNNKEVTIEETGKTYTCNNGAWVS